MIQFVYSVYQHKVDKWREQANITFGEALQREVQKCDSTFMIYHVNIEKEIHKTKKCNLANSSISMISLNADSLNKVWRELLFKLNNPIKTCTRISLLNNAAEISYSKAPFKLSSNNILCSFYIGTHCEIEVTGFINYNWWNILSIAIVLLLIGLGLLLFIVMKILERLIFKTTGKIKTAMSEDKDIPVSYVTQSSSTYQLEEGIYFYAELRTLKEGENVVKLTPQLSMLLEAFLKANQYELTQREIDELLWPDGSGTTERLYTAICRLRKILGQVSSFQIDCQIDIYRLKRISPIEK